MHLNLAGMTPIPASAVIVSLTFKVVNRNFRFGAQQSPQFTRLSEGNPPPSDNRRRGPHCPLAAAAYRLYRIVRCNRLDTTVVIWFRWSAAACRFSAEP